MKRRKLVLAAMIAAMAVPSLSAMAYDGDILTITADSDGDPFSWDTSTDKLAAMIEDKFGIDFQQSETNYYNNDFTVTQLAAVDGTLPDVFCADILYYTQEITQFIPEELVAEIPEELLDKYPLTKQLLENDAVSQVVKSMYDGYYFLPKPDSADPNIYKAERKGIFIRKDWLENVGMEMPTTWEDLYNVAHAFTYDDPDGNGVKDTYGLTGDGMGTLRYFFSSTGVSNRYWGKDEDGNWSYGALDDKNIELLEWLRKMYEDGSIDPDFGASTWETGLQKFSSNTFGMCVRNADADWINGVAVKYYGAANPDCNPFDRIDVIPALAEAEGETPRMDGYVSCMVATMFSGEIDEETQSTVFSRRMPSSTNRRAQAMAAAPAPLTTTRILSSSLPAIFAPFRSAAEEMIAVPCWSSCIRGMSSSSRRRVSISKHSGALMSSRLMPPKVGAMAFTVRMNSSGSVVSTSMSKASMPA